MRAAGVLLGVLLLAAARARAEPPNPESWELLYREDGLSVSADTTQHHPRYRAEGVIEANLFDLMAVLGDIDHRTQWMGGLAETRIVDGDVEKKVVIYEQYSLPWPCSNRDSVVESVITRNYRTLEVGVEYHETLRADVPPRGGVTRMPQVRGTMYFRYIDKTHSFARLVISLDVGGRLPEWAVNRFVRKAPVLTIEGLTKQVRKTRGTYRDFVTAHVAQARLEAQVPFEASDP